MRVASLRTMQKAARRFLKEAGLASKGVDQRVAENLIDFWCAVALVLHKEWERPRQHMLTKGIGVYCLMSLAGELHREASESSRQCDLDYFISALSDFVHLIDWSNQGPLKGFGGSSGADAALTLLRQKRVKNHSGYLAYA